MSEVPKIVHDRLRAGTPVGEHPDADVLTAFAEQALPTPEREQVLRHIARCRDCREVVALSLPPVEAVAGQGRAEEDIDTVAVRARRGGSWNWFTWPNLRWAALAAGVVVVASVLILRPGKQESIVAKVNRQAENVAPAADESAKLAAPTVVRPEPSAPKPDASFALKMSVPQAHGRSAAGVVATRNDRGFEVGQAGEKASQPVSVGSLADNKRAQSVEVDAQAFSVAAAPVTADKLGTSTERVEVPSRRPMSSSETVTVTGAAPAMNEVMARSDAPPPVVKAKAPKEEEARKKAPLAGDEARKQLAANYSASGSSALTLQKAESKVQAKDATPQWSLAQGALRRSLNSGATWQTVLQLEHPLLAFAARGNDVWTGGQSGTLFHSADSGATWTQVQPATKVAALSADVVAIEIRSPAEIVLSTSNHESWTTTDAGKTWEKK